MFGLLPQRLHDRDAAVPRDNGELFRIIFLRFQNNLAAGCFHQQNPSGDIPDGYDAFHIGVKSAAGNISYSQDVEELRRQILWVFSKEGQDYLISERPNYAAKELTVSGLSCALDYLVGEGCVTYKQLWHALNTLVEDGLLIATRENIEYWIMPRSGRRNHARYISGNKYRTPDFNPTQEDRDRAEMMCREREKRFMDKLFSMR